MHTVKDKILNIFEQGLDKLYEIIPRAMPTQDKLNKVKLIAHRGAHDHQAGIMENTMEAFDRAKEFGCFGIEFDIHSTKDGELVVHHDADLKRIFGIERYIHQSTWKELKTLAPKLPHIEDILSRYQHEMHYFIELKSPHIKESTLKKSLDGFYPEQDYHLLSLEPSLFNNIKEIPSEALLLVAMHNNIKSFYQTVLKGNYGGVLGHYLLYTHQLQKNLVLADKKIGVGYVASKNSLLREINRDIDWLFTNTAEKVSAILRELKQ